MPEGFTPSGEATIVVRPEHARLAGEGHLEGTVANIVYFGTDTRYHVALDGGGEFIVRRQNDRSGVTTTAVGERVTIAIADGSAQVLKD